MVNIEDEDKTPVTWNQYQSRVEKVVEEAPAHTQEAPDVTTLILNKYRQSSDSSVQVFKFQGFKDNLECLLLGIV
jgi:hypothetical protein